MAKKVTVTQFGLQGGTDRTVFITWTWTKEHTENYKVKWYYFVEGPTGGVWYLGEDGTVEHKQSVYNAPTNASQVKVTVKPIAKKHKVNGKETERWKADWSDRKEYAFSANPPATPGVPNVEIEKDTYILRATLDNLDINATSIMFQVVKDDLTVFKTSDSTIRFNDQDSDFDLSGGFVTYTCNVDAGHKYKVRARAYNNTNKQYSEWSQYSSNVLTRPAASKGITECRANSETSVMLKWNAVDSAETYDIEYTTKKTNFDYTGDTTTISDVKYTTYEVTGLEQGEEYFFRVRAVNEKGESAWSGIKSVILGEEPTIPTTWSTTTTAMVGEKVTLHWLHNSKDGSTQRYAKVEVKIGGVTNTYEINTVNEKDDEKTMHYVIDTSKYNEGTKIEWRVQTAGVTLKYSEWSITRTIDIYAPPTLQVNVVDSSDNHLMTVRSFPFYIRGIAGPTTQNPIGYHVTIVADEAYETEDYIGNTKIISADEEVYSQYFDTTQQLLIELTAGSINLENNISYTVICTATMDSGLTVESKDTFTVVWDDVEYDLNAEIGVDMETLTASIRPYCEDANGTAMTGMTMSVYRREFDGSFTELAKNIRDNNTFLTDPHPSLDYARYRVVGIDDATGAVSYYDLPGHPVGETSIIIQWDEDWSNFDVVAEDPMEEQPWSGSMLKLPYNIDISDNHRSDVTLVNYIGREHPVSYYGTQLGATSTWNAVIEKSDTERLYALRRLSRWMGNVYVREPSGSGYWANITVSFEIKHLELTIPVTLNVTRVSGGA